MNAVSPKVKKIPIKNAPPVGKVTYTFTVLVDEKLCSGCGICRIHCPSRLLKIVKRDGLPIEKSECQNTCPVDTNIRNAIKVLADEGAFENAWEIITDTNPIPAITGRVCSHHCEVICNRKYLDEPINICQIERFIGDYAITNNLSFKKGTEENKDKVAIVGAGPSGISCAYQLAKRGYHQVTVFERCEEPGGMLRYGIPRYRLPTHILDKELNRVKDLGVEFKYNINLGEDITLSQIRKIYKAVYLAVGAQSSVSLKMEEENFSNSFTGIDFLKSIAKGQLPNIGRLVTVIGGGNVAIDTARSALRYGATTVTIVCLEQRYEMPAWDTEIKEAIKEGIKIINGYGPYKIISTNAHITKVIFKRCISVFDPDGHFNPSYDENDQIGIDTDSLIVAIGQKPDCSFLTDYSELTTNFSGYIKIINPQVMTTAIEGVFAGGDVIKVAEAGTVCGAIAMGNKAALAIDAYLNKDKSFPVQDNNVKVTYDNVFLNKMYEKKLSRNNANVLELKRRFLNRDEEVNLSLSKNQAIKESGRCLFCGIGVATYTGPQKSELFNIACHNCHKCITLCPENAIKFDYYQKEKRRFIMDRPCV